jgi:hypothetical protein
MIHHPVAKAGRSETAEGLHSMLNTRNSVYHQRMGASTKRRLQNSKENLDILLSKSKFAKFELRFRLSSLSDWLLLSALHKKSRCMTAPAFGNPVKKSNYFFICAATSSAKFSFFFSRPSPVSKRTKPFTLIFVPFSLATWSTYFCTDCLPSSALT